MTLFLGMGLLIFLVANYGLQVEGGTKDPNEKEANKGAQSMVAPQATDKVTGQDTPKGDKISKQTGKDDSILEHEEHSNSDSSHEKDGGRISPKANHIDDAKSEKAAKIKNQGDSKKRSKEDIEGTEGNVIETGVQTTNNDKKKEKKPGMMKRVSSKLPFRKSDKKVNPPTNTGNEDSSKVTEIKDSTAASSSSESDVTKQKTKVGKSDTEKDIGKKLDENNPKGAGMGKDQTNEGSSSNESEGSKKKSNHEGKTPPKKYEAEGLKDTNKDKDSSSESSNDEENKPDKKAGQVKSPKTGPSKDTLSSNTENETINELGDKNANTPQSVDQPQAGKKPGMLGKLIHRPHLPGPNIARFLSRKDKQQAG